MANHQKTTLGIATAARLFGTPERTSAAIDAAARMASYYRPYASMLSRKAIPASILAQIDTPNRLGLTRGLIPNFPPPSSFGGGSGLLQQLQLQPHGLRHVAPFGFRPSEALRGLFADLRVPSFFSDFKKDWGPLFEDRRRAELLKNAGWLPHATLPMDLLDGADDPCALAEDLEAFYRTEWEGFRPKLEECLSRYEVDEESVACFKEALDNHSGERYRSVCRLLFPEIERVVRARFCPGRFDEITNVQILRTFAGELPLSEIGYFEIFRRLECHVYDKVRTSKSLQKMERDNVPNRHATIHGIIPYSGFAHSLNTIFMTEYVFKIIHMSNSDEFREELASSGRADTEDGPLRECFDLHDAADYRRFLKRVHGESDSQFWARMRREAKSRPDRFSTPVFEAGPVSPRPLS